MPKFLVKASYTAEGARGLLKEGGSARRATVQKAVEGLGGKLEAFYYAFGEADVYVHKKGLNEWDTCAPEALARAADFCVSRIDGSEHRYNQSDPRNDELVVCRPWLRERVLAALVAGRVAG